MMGLKSFAKVQEKKLKKNYDTHENNILKS